MNKMRINVVSRIAKGKDFFEPYLKVIANLKEKNIICEIKFIGQIYDEEIYTKILDSSKLLNIEELMFFTQKSIPYTEMTNEENEYYLNLSNGDFVGYSSIECLKNGFKTIFLNINSINTVKNEQITFCKNENELFNLLGKIYLNMNEMNKIIRQENEELLTKFYLSDMDKQLLLNTFKKIKQLK